MDLIILFAVILSLLMSFSIGSNDAANSLATSYGSNGLSLTKLVLFGAFFEFIGAMFCSSNVSKTLSSKIIYDLDLISVEEQKLMMLAVTFASFTFIMFSSFSGMPISATHTITGALMGAGIMVSGVDNVNWPKLL